MRARLRLLAKTSHPLYGRWQGMMKRCHNKNNPCYKDWGGRGITVCERWKDFWAYVQDIKALGTPPSPSHSIDRIDNDGNYKPGNVRWATPREQVLNSRSRSAANYEQIKLMALEMLSRGDSKSRIERITGLCSKTVRDIIKKPVM
jgi:hypothetical protein